MHKFTGTSSDKNTRLLFYCIITGLTSACAALLLKTGVYYIHHLLTIVPDLWMRNYIFLAFPLVGILLTVGFIRVFFGDSFSRGSAQILKSIAVKESNVDSRTTWSHLITSAITVGLGGSAGLESPIVVTGAAIGSNYGKLFKLGYRDKTLLLACGAAAGIAAVFNAPIAGVMFALEVILVDVSISSFLPLIVSGATGALLSKILLDDKILFSFILHTPFNYHNVPFYFGLALLTGLISVYYIRSYHLIERFTDTFGNRYFYRALTGGIILGVLMLLFPPLFGEGYSAILALTGNNPAELFKGSIAGSFSNDITLLALLVFVVALMKVIAASLTINSGGNGGNFAPSLFVGAFTGFAYAQLIKQITGNNVPVANFTIVGMAGILSGVFHAPLTAIFLIAEITGGYQLMLPLMIVSAISFIITRKFEPHSLEKKKLARKGELITEDRDKNLLSLMDLSDVLETDYLPVNYKESIRNFAELLTKSKRNIFPVLNDDGGYLGSITMDTVRKVLFDLKDYEDMPALELMNENRESVSVKDSLEAVMTKMEEGNYWNLPVVENGRYIGFVSKSGILAKYRKQLQANT